MADSPKLPKHIVDHNTSVTIPEEDVPSIVIFDKNDPRALINLVPNRVAERIHQAIEQLPELFSLDEIELKKALRENEATPNAIDNRVRLKFWMEYDRASTSFDKFKIANVVAGICSLEYFYAGYLRSPTKVAWLMCPPTNYTVKAEEALEFGLEQLRDILALDHGSGLTANTKLMELKAKIVAMLDQRVKGAVVQKSMNIHAIAGNKHAATAIMGQVQPMTMEEIEKKLKLLDDRQKRLLNGGLEVGELKETAIESHSFSQAESGDQADTGSQGS